MDSEIKAKIDELRKLIWKHNYYYHVMDTSLISDYEFDMLYKKLKDLEDEYPEFYDPDSPTQRVGGYVVEIIKNQRIKK